MIILSNAWSWVIHQLSDGAALRIGITTILLTILLSPVVRYLMDGWKAKRLEMLSYFDNESALEYFNQFLPQKKISKEDACGELEHLYDQSMGRRLYIVPTFVLFIVSFFACWAAVGTGLGKINLIEKPGLVLPDVAHAAVSGAYMWVASELIMRMRRRDFGPSDLFFASLRLAIAIPLGYAFATIAAPDIGPFIAFSLGAFPLEPLVIILRRLASKRLGLEEKEDEAADQVSKLQGVNREIADRFAQSDIFTISQLAEADPVSLSRRTNLSFNFVLDCISQALAWNYFGPKLDTLRPLGLRGAFEIRNFVLSLDGIKNSEDDYSQYQPWATAALPHISAAAQIPTEALQVPLREISEDPYTIFIHRIFH